MASTKDKAEAAGREARAIGEDILEKGAEAAQTVKETARDYAERAKDEVQARAEEYRGYAATEAGRVASALRRASHDLSSGSPQERFIGQIADGVADAADRMRSMTLTDVARDTNDFARRNPAAFLGGAALLGFAVARFVKASARDEATGLPPHDGDEGTSVAAPSTASAPFGRG